MAQSMPPSPAKLNPDTQAIIEKYLGEGLSETDLLEIKASLYHLGKALCRYHQMRKQEVVDES